VLLVRKTRLSPLRHLRRVAVERLLRVRKRINMKSKATSRFIRMSPQKARLVVDLIRGKNVNEALMTLKFTNKPKSTREIEKVVKSAVANATQKDENVDVDNLFVETCFINEGPRLKRIRPAPMGRAYRYQRRTSHITIELGERE
jgi:large subunit ribosomal protein L22